jgi:cation/acetate symporter
VRSSASPISIALFFIVIMISLAVTYWAARRSKTTSELYAAGGRITAWQNGFALTGDLLSAATFLGLVGLYFTGGYDAILYNFPTMVGFAIMVGFIVVPLRRLGKYTFADVAAVRLSPPRIRILAAISAVAVSLMYMIVQMVGAGSLIQILFGIPYRASVVIVGALMTVYVAFGGMLATTWVQIIKCVLLLGCLLALAILALSHANFSLNELYTRAAHAHRLGANLFQPGGLKLPLLQSASLTIGIALGMLGMPHVLMRFFTVRSPQIARQSVIIAMALIAFAIASIFLVIGPAAVAFIAGNSAYTTTGGAPFGGTNMVTLHLASFVGGDILFGGIAAVTFATILAVVSGLTIAAASALSHDLYASVFARGRFMEKQEAVACILIGLVSVILGCAFEGQNILYLTAMSFSIAASACFPVLVMSIYWRPLTTQGALAGGYAGLCSALALIILGPSVWVSVLKNPAPIVPMDYPAIFSVPIAFVVMIVVSLSTREVSAGMTAPVRGNGFAKSAQESGIKAGRPGV